MPRIAIPQSRSADPAYNAKIMPHYCEAVERAGGEPVEVPLELDNHGITRLAASCDGLLLPGSHADVNPQKYGAARQPQTAPDDPRRDNADELLLQDAYSLRKPIFGICYGLQSLNVWRSGGLVQHLATGVAHERVRPEDDDAALGDATHHVLVDATSRLGQLVLAGLAFSDPDLAAHPERGEGSAVLDIVVNSSHHQAVERCGDGLRRVAWCPEDNVVEALETTAADHWVLAVQWHPERLLDNPVAQALWLGFVEAARRYEARNRGVAATY
jgi:putative glutamine amidotransferase